MIAEINSVTYGADWFTLVPLGAIVVTALVAIIIACFKKGEK